MNLPLENGKTNGTHSESGAKVDVKIKRQSTQQRIILNIGGHRYETYTSTLNQFPTTLLGAMFSEQNREMLKPDSRGEFFFDRSPECFTSILNWYRTGVLEIPLNVQKKTFLAELDFWQIPETMEEEKLGDRVSEQSMDALRKKTERIMTKLKNNILKQIEEAATVGHDEISIEFKETNPEIYTFLSNFSHRELLLHDLLAERLEVSFNDVNFGQGHSYVLSVTLWNRFSRLEQVTDISAVNQILRELKEGVEVKTNRGEVLKVLPVKSMQ